MQPKSFSIGIDIGGTQTAWGIVNRRGEILEQQRFSTKGFDTPEDFVAHLADQLQPIIKEYDTKNISGIGIGAPNANFYTGEIMQAANLPWKGRIQLRNMVETANDLPVTITNDANATAIGEMTYGAAKGMSDFIIITLGTGVGSGFVANGQLIYGHDGFAGELGHVTAVRDGRDCGCGRKGCLETYSSATGIVKTANLWLEERKEQLEKSDNPHWLSTQYRSGNTISSSGIYNAAIEGDPLAREIFDYTGMILGRTLADAVAITSPEAIILFGGLAKAGDLIMEPTRQHMEKNLLPIYRGRINMIQSGLEERDAAILGASALAWGN